MEAPNRKRIRTYYRNQKRVPPKWTWITVLVGIPFLYFYGAGLLPIAVGGWGLRKWFKRAKDTEVDAAQAGDISRVLKRALGSTMLSQEELVRESILLTGPRIWDAGKAEIAFRVGKDGYIRHNPIAITCLFFTAKYLDVYQCIWDSQTGKLTEEITSEYFYIDIISADIQTMDKRYALSKPDRKKLENYEDLEPILNENKLVLDDAKVFIIATTGGASVQHLISAPGLIDLTGTGEFPMGNIQDAIQAIRQITREARSSSDEETTHES